MNPPTDGYPGPSGKLKRLTIQLSNGGPLIFPIKSEKSPRCSGGFHAANTDLSVLPFWG